MTDEPKANAALAHLVNLVQLILGKLQRIADGAYPAVSALERERRKQVVLTWALGLIVVGMLVESWWESAMCGS